MQRRTLLKLLALAPVAGGAVVGAMSRSANAAAAGGKRTLILVELAGGNDGLNTVAPVGDALYRKLRPNLAVDEKRALSLAKNGGGLALHPSLAKLMPVWDAGELAVVVGVGYPKPVRSHFRSADIWHTASGSDVARTDGWIARVLASAGDVTKRGLVVAGDAGPLDGPGFSALAADGDKTSRRTERPSTNAALAHLARVHDEVRAARADIDRVLGDDEIGERLQRGRNFTEQCRVAAKAVAGLDVAVVKLTLKGFDTHAGQAPAHARLLEELAEGLALLRDRCRADGTWSRVLVATVSEFGRRARENASGGTDHGAASCGFVVGGGVSGGVVGAQPSLADLDEEGDVKMTQDYRALLGGLARACWPGIGERTVTSSLGGLAPLRFT